jgi:hypothetical protein
MLNDAKQVKPFTELRLLVNLLSSLASSKTVLQSWTSSNFPQDEHGCACVSCRRTKILWESFIANGFNDLCEQEELTALSSPNFSQPSGCNRVSHAISWSCLDRRLRSAFGGPSPSSLRQIQDLSQSTRFRYEVCEKPGLAPSRLKPRRIRSWDRLPPPDRC